MYFEFSDAEVAHCGLQGGVLTLRFSAARGQDSRHAEPQWQPVHCVATGVVVPSGEGDGAGDGLDTADWIGRLDAGCVRQGGQRWRQLPLPWYSSTPVQLELEWARGGAVQLDCQTLALSGVEGRAAVEAYQC